ncbi:Uricase-2 isozyme 2 [Dendrobium catenatum]|uniref:Uricase n=1 Tax=Dendrobium catenatum TaxID=906689 RepID=A0A2I0WT32_9ASPA|nr:Uricase-2 isozyme 2 [Dendrobium catenatum]
MAGGFKLEQQHGKGRVRVSRVWRKAGEGGADVIVEWNVSISLLSDCLEAYTDGDNSSIVATDTMKNTVNSLPLLSFYVYAKAKECTEVESPESFAIRLAKHFTSFYPKVTTAIISIVEKPWEQVVVDGRPHAHVDFAKLAKLEHGRQHKLKSNASLPNSWSELVSISLGGFKLGSEKHTTEVNLKKFGALRLISGIQGLSLLKTTQSGFEGFIRDRYTLLPETKERMLATEVTALWRAESPALLGAHFMLAGFLLADLLRILLDRSSGPVQPVRTGPAELLFRLCCPRF